MKDAKHFVQISRVGHRGNVSGAVILTPPLDTAQQALDYATWFNQDGNHLRGAVQQAMMVNGDAGTLIVRTFETTLY